MRDVCLIAPLVVNPMGPSKSNRLSFQTYVLVSNSLYELISWGFTAKLLPSGDLFVHDDVIKWKHFPRYWPFVRRIHRSPVNSQHKGQWRGVLMFSLICVWINGWVNNREAGDLSVSTKWNDIFVVIQIQWDFRFPLIQFVMEKLWHYYYYYYDLLWHYYYDPWRDNHVAERCTFVVGVELQQTNSPLRVKNLQRNRPQFLMFIYNGQL